MQQSAIPPLQVEHVSKNYGKLKALDAVNFTLASGFYALLGPNGAGKSTLYQLLTGLFVPDSGRIMVAGEDISQSLPRALAKMGVVFQQPSLDLDLTVKANLIFYGRMHGMAKADIIERSHTELAKLDLADSLDKRCRTLSGGNRRKVELARALLTEPDILLMDEATVGLDPASRELILQHVHELCQLRGMAVLWSTHLIDEAERADHVLILHKGQLLAMDTPQQLMADLGVDRLLAVFLQLSGETIPTVESV